MNSSVLYFIITSVFVVLCGYGASNVAQKVRGALKGKNKRWAAPAGLAAFLVSIVVFLFWSVIVVAAVGVFGR